MGKRRLQLGYPPLVALGFGCVILLGSLLLMLPISSQSGTATPFLSCLFTATSATCVTGLIVVDTYLHWSLFGRIVIITLIQIGGLGVMTLMATFSMALHRQISLRERTFLKESFNTPDMGGMIRLTRKILVGTLVVESAGAVVFATRLVPRFGWSAGIGRAVFLSISAFCNAGFDLFGDQGAYSSLTAFANDGVLIITAAALILIGGIGFLVWDDVLRHKWHFRRYRLHSKLVLTVTAAITVICTLLFVVLERNHTGAGLPLGQQVLNGFFASVTPRTAGFNSVDVNQMHPASGMLTTILMLVGGSPGSTAGGVKTTTFAVLIICCVTNLLNRSGFNLFRRRLSSEVVVQAICVAVMQLSMAFIGIFLVSAAQPELGLTDVIYECFSAINTVGISTGITRDLTAFSQVVVILLMYCGRLGTMTFAVLFVQKKKKDLRRYAEETISVG